MKRLFALGALMVTASTLAALPPLIPRDVLFGNPDKASPRLSPDGVRLAYLAPDTNNVLNVWVRTLGQKDDQVLTADKKRGIRTYFWQPDSEHVLYLQDADGDENWHLYQTSLKSKNTRDLTPFQGVQAQVVAVDPNFPDEILVGLNLEDRQLHDVYRVNLKTGAVELDTKNPGDVSGWTADNALQVRVASVFAPDGGTELRVREDARSAWRAFQKWSADETFGGVAAFTPDNKGAWIVSSVDANAARLMEFDLASGTGKVVAEDAQYDVGGLLTHPTRRTLEAVNFVRARTEWQILDPAVRSDFGLLQATMDGDLEVVSRDLADTKWVVAFVVDNGPVYYYLYDREKTRRELLFTNRARLAKYELARMAPISFTARDGLTIHGYATLVGLTFTPNEFSCGVDIVGPSSIVTLIKSIPPYWVPLKSVFDKRVGKIETEVEFLNSRSPLYKADQIKVPLLIAQGANDPRVKQAESDQIVAAMRKNNKPVDYLVFPDEGHGFARPENRLVFYAAAEQFLTKYLGGRAEPAVEKEKWEALLK